MRRPATQDPAGPINAYVTQLGGMLRGSRRRKADILTEVHDGLTDAAEAYELHLPRAAAQRRAVEEFGSVRLLAPALQAELDLAQGRHTALLVAAVLALQPLLWNHLAALIGVAPAAAPGAAYALVDHVVEWLGAAAIAGALLAALACGSGARVLRPDRATVHGIGVFALAACGVFGSTGLLLALLGHGTATVVGAVGFLWLPLTGVAASARHCLAAA